MKDTHKDLDYKEFINIFNTNGKKAAKEFISNYTDLNYDHFVRLLKKYTGYVYNRNIRKYELPLKDDAQFISMDSLLNKDNRDATKIVASLPEKIYYKDPIDTLNIELLQDRLLELSNYIKISQSSKTIEINLVRLREASYDINVIN